MLVQQVAVAVSVVPLQVLALAVELRPCAVLVVELRPCAVLVVELVPLALPPVQVVQRGWLTYRLAHTHLAGLPHLPLQTTRQGSRRRGYAHRDQPFAHLGC